MAAVDEHNAKTCFIIMPYGKRADGGGEAFDFDRLYADVLRGPVAALGLAPVRCDEIMRAGSIHKDMFVHIATAEVAIVDLTLLNPNVFYELGVRHALRPSVTVLVKRRGSPLPFNIQGERVVEYPGPDGTYESFNRAVTAFIQAGLASASPDSPIFNVLQDARKDWKAERIDRPQDFPYRLTSQPGKRVTIITGDLRGRRNIDVWVNSENTNMQMARFFDRTLSAIVRYEGAKKDDNGEILEDTIADELKAATGGREYVTPGSVYVTGAGDLAKTRCVKKVFHAASVYGVPGGGYKVIQDVEQCVTAALRRMDHPNYAADDLRTIAFPMMGTGAGGGPVDAIAPKLIRAAVSYLESHPEGRVSTVYFSAWNHRDLEACQAALKSMREVEPA